MNVRVQCKLLCIVACFVGFWVEGSASLHDESAFSETCIHVHVYGCTTIGQMKAEIVIRGQEQEQVEIWHGLYSLSLLVATQRYHKPWKTR